MSIDRNRVSFDTRPDSALRDSARRDLVRRELARRDMVCRDIARREFEAPRPQGAAAPSGARVQDR
jgi:hypothetical protein